MTFTNMGTKLQWQDLKYFNINEFVGVSTRNQNNIQEQEQQGGGGCRLVGGRGGWGGGEEDEQEDVRKAPLLHYTIN